MRSSYIPIRGRSGGGTGSHTISLRGRLSGSPILPSPSPPPYQTSHRLFCGSCYGNSSKFLDSKGLDFQRQKHLTNSIRNRARELSSCLMLVLICEETDTLRYVFRKQWKSSLLCPDGDCPLCLYPLVPEDEQKNALPFIKLMSCFHCFHRHKLKHVLDKKNCGALEESMGNCPVYRKVFHTQDFEGPERVMIEYVLFISTKWAEWLSQFQNIHDFQYLINGFSCITGHERIELSIDPGTWDPMNEDMVSLDPIEFHSKEELYKDRIDSYKKNTGLIEAVQTGIGQLNGIPVAIGVMDFQFMGGSMGSCASGGARMQEGSLSLMQMAKISSTLYDYQLNKKLFYVAILTSPTTGRVTASFGKRVIEQTLNKTVPEDSQLQQENSGLIEPKKDLVVLPGMVLPVSPSVSVADNESTEQQQREPPSPQKCILVVPRVG
ncbi:hypothetical protein DVH24_025938 [Malus domestica]|uniref:CoA carboxyltransferase N-terminal domain-containing protein n=1 Tax=Malus domestica TaxID=3750 RepID=A0A498KMB8_MALDO|nr:hypothetical protein DVH24_025938 [Malus domestica]